MTAESRILEVARSVRSDAWVALASNGAFAVGFADNRTEVAETYNADAERVAGDLKAAGFRVTVRAGNAHWPFAIIKVHA